MKIKKLTTGVFPVPFRYNFSHASARRGRAENLIVIAEDDEGLVGFGEGCPRDYVTGETVSSARQFVQDHMSSIVRAVNDIASLREWIISRGAEIDRNPAAFCAIELALLDLFGKSRGMTLETLLKLPPLAGEFYYSAILGDSNRYVYRFQFGRYWNSGFRDFKIKLSGDPKRDRKKFSLFEKQIDPDLRLRADANNLWKSSEICIERLREIGYPLFAVEEPLAAGQIDQFRMVAQALETRIILDESFVNAKNFDDVSRDPENWILNFRVSKLGGLIRSLDLAPKSAERNLAIIVGAHVGETSVLSRAALTLGHSIGHLLVAREGAFGTHFLKRDLCSKPIMFGPGGKLSVDELAGAEQPGLGLEIDPQLLSPAFPKYRRYSVRREGDSAIRIMKLQHTWSGGYGTPDG